jgi:CubicO group peptidase (beta-lactamase class C family)
MKTLLLLCLGVTLLTGCGIPMEQSIAHKNDNASNFLDEQVKRSKIPGIQYIVMTSSRIVFEYADGWADIEHQRPMKANTTMMAYSMTKTITAVAVLQLIEKEKLHLNDSVAMYLPNNPYGKTITIGHLLSQTSGIPNPIPLRWAHATEKHEEFDEHAALAKVLEDNPKTAFEAGKKYGYSNISYWLLGKIVAKASGQTYEAYVRDHILNPLKLTENEMSFTISDHAHHAKGYLAKYSFMNLFKGFLINRELFGEYEGKWLHINSHYLNGPAFGGLVGSADSFRIFLQDQLKEESVLFNKNTRNIFFTPQKNSAGEYVDMTLGWHVGDLEGMRYVFKEGGGGGYHCEMRIYPTKGIASIIMVNRTSFNSKKYLHTLDREFLF